MDVKRTWTPTAITTTGEFSIEYSSFIAGANTQIKPKISGTIIRNGNNYSLSNIKFGGDIRPTNEGFVASSEATIVATSEPKSAISISTKYTPYKDIIAEDNYTKLYDLCTGTNTIYASFVEVDKSISVSITFNLNFYIKWYHNQDLSDRYILTCVLSLKLPGTKPKPTYTITFTDNGGSQTRSGVYEVTAPSPIQSEYSVSSKPSSTTVTYTLNQNYEDGTGKVSKKTLDYITTTNTTTKYNFSSWSPGSYRPGAQIQVSGNKTYTGYYQSTSSSSSTEKWDPASYFTLENASSSDKTFLGWYSAKTNGSFIGKSGSTLTPVSTVTNVYAQWECSVKFDGNGGSVVGEASKKVKYNTKLTSLPSATRTGYTFKGWYTDKTGGTPVNSDTNVTKNVTYYAQWLTNYTITYNTNGGSAVSQGTKVYGKSVKVTSTVPSKSTKSGSVILEYNGGSIIGTSTFSSKTTYKFINWTCSYDKVTYTSGAEIPAKYNSNLIFTANYSIATTAKLPDLSDKIGYKFLGWNETKTAKTASWKAGSTYSSNKESVTLYAIYEPIERTETLRYYKGGTAAETKEEKKYTIETAEFSINAPSNSWGNDYVFLGWAGGTDANKVPDRWNSSNKGVYSQPSEAPDDVTYPLIINPKKDLGGSYDNWGIYDSSKMKYKSYGRTTYWFGCWVVTGKYVKVNTWRKIMETYVKIDDKWRLVTDMYTKVGGVWKKEVGKQ